MDRRSSNHRASSLRGIKAYSQSFSCGEFGAFDLDLDEDDYEAMAAEAEAEAQERINNIKGRDSVIDGLLECGESDTSNENGNKTPQSPPRGGEGAGLAYDEEIHDNNSRKRWEPQKMVKHNGEEKDTARRDRARSTRQDSQNPTRSHGDEEKHHASAVRRKDSNGSSHSSVDNSGVSWEKSVKMNDDKSEMVLASATGGAQNAAIHINAPNVTINYIVEQKVESRSEHPRHTERVSEFPPGNDYYASRTKECNVVGEPSLSSDGRNKQKNNGSAKNYYGGEIEEDEHAQRKAMTVQSLAHKNEVAKFVAPAQALPEQTRGAMAEDVDKEPKSNGLNLDSLSKPEADFNESLTTMTASVSSHMSRRGGQTVSSASVSTIHSTKVPRNVQERGASTQRSAPKPAKMENSTSQPYDLSDLLDSLWSPTDPEPSAKSTTQRTSILRGSSRPADVDSDSSDSGVYTAGCNDYGAPGEADVGEHGDVAQCSNQAMPSLSQIDERSRMAPAQQSLSDSEGNIHGPSEIRPVLKSASSSWGGGERQGGIHGASQIRPKLKTASSSLAGGEMQDENEDSMGTRGSRGMWQSSTSRPEPQDKSNEVEANKQYKNIGPSPRSGSRSPSQGQADSRRIDNTEDMMSKLSQFELKGDKFNSEKEPTVGQHVSFSNEPPKKPSMRDLLLPIESDRELSVYEDVSIDNDSDPTPKKRIHGLQMGAIAENDGECSVASSVPEYKIDSEISEFARDFVNQFSKQEDDKKKRMHESLAKDRKLSKENGSGRSPTKEVEMKRAALTRQRGWRASAVKMDKMIENKIDAKLAKRSNGEKPMHDGMNNQDRPHRQAHGGISRSMKVPKSKIIEQVRFQRSKSVLINAECKPGDAGPPSKERRRSGINQNSKYVIGDSLQSAQDMMKDSSDEKLLRLDVLDHVFVRRSGGQWTYSIVTDISENHMTFVVDRNGSKKTVERRGLAHNVRLLNYYTECSKRREMK